VRALFGVRVLTPPPFVLRTLRETQPWTSPQVSERYLSAHHYPAVGQISPRTRKSMSLDMGQPSQANTKKLLGRPVPPEARSQNPAGGPGSPDGLSPPGTRKSFDHLISDSKAPKRPEMESGMTTPPKMRRVAESDYEIGESRRRSHEQEAEPCPPIGAATPPWRAGSLM